MNPVRCGFKLDPDTITNYIEGVSMLAKRSRIDIERQRDESVVL